LRAGLTSGEFTFGEPRRLIWLQAHNTGSVETQLRLVCLGGSQPDRLASLAPGATRTIETGWSGTCSGVQIHSSNGWDTNFDNLMLEYVDPF
jgi:hypothetical protein